MELEPTTVMTGRFERSANARTLALAVSLEYGWLGRPLDSLPRGFPSGPPYPHPY